MSRGDVSERKLEREQVSGTEQGRLQDWKEDDRDPNTFSYPTALYGVLYLCNPHSLWHPLREAGVAPFHCGARWAR